MVQSELEKWGKAYVEKGMKIFCPSLPDMESYYVTPEHFSLNYPVSLQQAQNEISSITADAIDSFRKKYKEKRRDAIKKFWVDGGGPSTDQLWPTQEGLTEDRILGKDLLPRINKFGQEKYNWSRNLFDKPSLRLINEIHDFLTFNKLI